MSKVSGAKIRMFLIHCLGRMVLIRPVIIVLFSGQSWIALRVVRRSATNDTKHGRFRQTSPCYSRMTSRRSRRACATAPMANSARIVPRAHPPPGQAAARSTSVGVDVGRGVVRSGVG